MSLRLTSICGILMGRRIYTGKSESVTTWDMWNRCFAKFELRPRSIVLIRHWSLCIITHAQGTRTDGASCLPRLLSCEHWNKFHCNENHCWVCSLEMQWYHHRIMISCISATWVSVLLSLHHICYQMKERVIALNSI